MDAALPHPASRLYTRRIAGADTGQERCVVLEGYPITVEIPVAWGDMDAYGHVNNTVFFRWFETARMAFLRAVGFASGGEGGGLGPIVASTSCRFVRPVAYPDTIIVGVRAERLQEDRFTHRYRVVRAATGEVVADGECVVVSYDYGAARKAPIPPHVRDAIERLAGDAHGAE